MFTLAERAHGEAVHRSTGPVHPYGFFVSQPPFQSSKPRIFMARVIPLAAFA